MSDTNEAKGFVRLEDIDWSSGGEKADTIYLQWNEPWGIWEQVIDEAMGRPGVAQWTRATTAQAENEALRAKLASVRADVFAVLRHHDVSQECFAAVAAVTFVRTGDTT